MIQGCAHNAGRPPLRPLYVTIKTIRMGCLNEIPISIIKGSILVPLLAIVPV